MNTQETIFELLYKAQDFVSGEQLAQQLNCSRTAIWKAIQQLEKAGVSIISVKNKGYHWQAGDLLLPERIAADTGLNVHLNPQSASTQLDAKQGIQAGQAAPTLYLAPSQSGAHGRFNRPFFAPRTGGIYMSLHLSPQVSFDQMPPYTVLVAASIVKAIQELCGIPTNIKWVNDLYLGQKKIAGILTEAISSVETGTINEVIIGVGLNFHVTDFPSELADKAGSLFETPPPLTRNALIAKIWQIFLTSAPADLLALYRQHSLVLGRDISYSQAGVNHTARAIDITDDGHLVVENTQGQRTILSSGEISLSSW